MKFVLILLLSSSCLYSIDFNKDIKPILARKCFSCHGPKNQKGKLRLDIREEALGVLTEKNGRTELLSRINHTDSDEIMPPPDETSLKDLEKDLLKQWIIEGAVYEKHWSFKQIAATKPPKVKSDWTANNIDRFILKKLNDLNLSPQPVIFDHNLLKRVSFKLTGLPPDQKDLKLLKQGKLQYQDYVEKLLQSPHYGEHMATFWLDAARYADTNGIEYDISRPIWPYRDWVIKAFNDNMPYDQFISEQIAGDLLPNSTLSQKIATGFLRSNLSTNEPGSIEEEFQIRYAKDRLNTTMTSITGLSVSCAECHDHKYDPISQKEYYQLLAYFNNINGKAVGTPYQPANDPIVLIQNNEYKKYLNLEDKKALIDKKLSSLRQNQMASFEQWHTHNQNSPTKALYLLSQFELFFSFDETETGEPINIINDEKGDIRGTRHSVSGKHESALKGSESFYIDCPKTSVFDQNTKFSAGFWINPEKGSKGEILGQFYNFKGWKIEIDEGFINFVLSNSKDSALIVQSTSPLPIDAWSHITVTYDGTAHHQGINIYINENKEKTKTLQDNLKGSSFLNAVLRVGSYLDHTAIDDVFITKSLLTKENISSIANFHSASRLVHYKHNDLSKRNLTRLKNYYFENIFSDYAKLHKNKMKIQDKLDLLVKYNSISLVMEEKAIPNITHILIRGDYQKKGKSVTPKTPDFLSYIPKSPPHNRLGLANWLTHKSNPLTARVIVNRIWYKLFNRGLFSTLDDIGIQGSYPTHPLLLDFLSNYLIEKNWDIKKLITLIVNSSTFKQKYKSDSIFAIYQSYPKHRLYAEEIRDQLLTLSGLFNSKIGGPPVFPYQPAGLWSEVTSDNSNTKYFKQSDGDDNYRRSIYTFWKRSSPPPSMILFDAPSRQVCIMERATTNTPLQALSLMNDRQFTELYSKIIDTLDLHKTKKEKVDYIFEKLFLRAPTYKEIQLTAKIQSKKDFIIFVHAMLNTDEFLNIK